MISDLEKLGFKKAGKWDKSEKYKSKVDIFLNKFEDQRVIYCFVVDSSVKYIGVCDSYKRTLKDRMNKYRSRNCSQKSKTGTSLEIVLNIKKYLEEGKLVEVYAFVPSNKNHYQKMEVDLIRGLEYPLIQKFNPQWNKSGKK